MISFPVSCLIRELALAVAEVTCALLERTQSTHFKDGNKWDVLFSFARNISTSRTLKKTMKCEKTQEWTVTEHRLALEMNVFHFYNRFFLWPDNFWWGFFFFFKNGFNGNYILYSFFDTFTKGSSLSSHPSLHLTLSVHPSDLFSFTPFSPANLLVQCMSTSETETTVTSTLLIRIMNMMVNLCQYY